jgi:hypothetical protein
VLHGDVLIRTDEQGRVAVIVDEAWDESGPDGLADRLYILTPARPVTTPIARRLPHGVVIFRGASLYVASAEESFTADLAVRTGDDARHEVAQEHLLVHDGIGLRSSGPGQNPAPLEDVSIEDIVTVVRAQGPGAGQACESGGPHALECTKKCSFSAASFTRTDECSVKCDGAASFACCSCGAMYDSRCQCIEKEVVRGLTPSIERTP